MKVLIIGAGGQLGHDLVPAFAGTAVLGLTHAELDITDPAAVSAAVRNHRPGLVVHAAAFTKVDACETERDRAWRTNTAGAWWVARACAGADAAMVLVSTDYVFDGTSTDDYTEFDAPAPLNVYGRTKVAAEQLVRETVERHYIVRTSWLHGPSGANFLRTILRLADARDELAVVDDQVGSPTFTFDLAPAIRRLVDSAPPGTYHLTNAGHTSWHGLAEAALSRTGRDVKVRAITSAEFGAPAPRPARSVLDNRRAWMLGLPALPHWSESLDRFLSMLDEPHAG